MADRRRALADLPVRRGKVRDIYDLGDRLLLVASDRISAFDWVLPTVIPDKGRILTGLSDFWFSRLGVAHHRLSGSVDDLGLDLSDAERADLAGRSTVARKCRVIPFECVVRGYLAGSGWREYQESGTVCGVPLPAGLVEAAAIDPIFTPATKAESGHDENVSPGVMADAIGRELTERLATLSTDLYRAAAEHAASRGLILADTKFEFGIEPASGDLLLIDEALTPDSSRYWPADAYRPGKTPASFDKQGVRDWLLASGWDRSSPPPALPDDVVATTRARYVHAYETLTGQTFAGK